MYNNELYHFGVKGMHWGIRRYQNKDGSLTSAGRRHRGGVVSNRKPKLPIGTKIDGPGVNKSKLSGTATPTSMRGSKNVQKVLKSSEKTSLDKVTDKNSKIRKGIELTSKVLTAVELTSISVIGAYSYAQYRKRIR